MALYKVTTKNRRLSAGMLVEKGMSIQIATLVANPVTNVEVAKQVNDLFIRNYGVDLKKMGILNTAYLEVEKIG